MNDHGIFSLNLDCNILTVEGYGPWNKEAMKISFANAELMLKIRGKVKWGIIAIIHGDPLHTPDAAELLVGQIKEDKRHGRIATAFILIHSTAPNLVNYIFLTCALKLMRRVSFSITLLMPIYG